MEDLGQGWELLQTAPHSDRVEGRLITEWWHSEEASTEDNANKQAIRVPIHVFHGFIAEMLAGRIQPQQICSPARRLFRPARFFNAEVERIDLEGQRVVTSRLLDGREYHLEYDHLVLALGSVDDLSRYPGIAAHTQRLKTYWDCFKARMHLLSMLEMAEIAEDEGERRRLLTFVVVGAGYGGIEVAA